MLLQTQEPALSSWELPSRPSPSWEPPSQHFGCSSQILSISHSGAPLTSPNHKGRTSTSGMMVPDKAGGRCSNGTFLEAQSPASLRTQLGRHRLLAAAITRLLLHRSALLPVYGYPIPRKALQNSIVKCWIPVRLAGQEIRHRKRHYQSQHRLVKHQATTIQI